MPQAWQAALRLAPFTLRLYSEPVKKKKIFLIELPKVWVCAEQELVACRNYYVFILLLHCLVQAGYRNLIAQSLLTIEDPNNAIKKLI